MFNSLGKAKQNDLRRRKRLLIISLKAPAGSPLLFLFTISGLISCLS